MGMPMNRRDFLRLAGISIGVGAIPASSIWHTALAAVPAQTGPSPYGPFLPPDSNGIMLPAGFSSRVVARAGETVGSTHYVWPVAPDGGAVFRLLGGHWIYVVNSEWIPPSGGGVSAIRFGRRGEILAAYSICTGTFINCAGGSTPWGTWLTCEEYSTGHVWECQPLGNVAAKRCDALGTFAHEAVAVDPRRRALYLTEDVSDGRFYRFTPNRWRHLQEGGTLEAAVVASDGGVTWLPVPQPNPSPSGIPTRHQVAHSTPFRGGEGVTYSRNHVYFTTKGDNRVWDYDVRAQRLTVFYDRGLDPGMTLGGVDNVTVAKSRDLVVAEDGGNMELVLLSPGGVASPLLRVVGQDGSELTGPAFAPGNRLYFNSQRGGSGGGITYEVIGPFRRRARD
jgi:secreted PhoX family phosphatase